jgi:hypothetical protein
MITERFWHLFSPESTKKLAEWVHGEVILESVRCPACEGHQRSGRRVSDLSVVLPGTTIDDFIWTWQSDCLIQDRALKLFQERGFTGFQVKPARARFKRAETGQAPTLWELVVTGWAGMAPAESGIRVKQRCPACGHTTYTGCAVPARLIDESQWDGSDFFIVCPLPKFKFVTSRVAESIREAELTGANLRPLRDMKPTKGYGPGRLSYFMPERRARELGEPLGIY